MLNALTISDDTVLHQAKLSCKIPELVEAIIARKVITNTAAEVGITVKAEELQQTADRFRFVNNLKTADATWKWIEEHHLSLDEFEEILHNNLLAQKLASHLFADKVEPYFFANRLDYVGASLYEVILEDKDLAIEIFYALQEGEITFPEVAHTYIQNQALRRIGGYRGMVKRRELKPEVAAAVFSVVQPPQILQPIISSLGVHLLLVDELLQPELNESLYQDILSNLFSRWLKEEIEGFKVSML